MEVNPDHYFDHDADIGIIGKGRDLTTAFINAAEAVFAIMTDLDKVSPQQMIEIEFDEDDIEFALVTWLNKLINAANSKNMIFCRFELHQNSSHWHGKAWGETWHDELPRGTDVKGATLTMLSVKKTDDTWEAKCVVDV